MTTQSPTAEIQAAEAQAAATETPAPDAVATPDVRAGAPAKVTAETEPEVEELLIEEISIDGMCGVY